MHAVKLHAYIRNEIADAENGTDALQKLFVMLLHVIKNVKVDTLVS